MQFIARCFLNTRIGELHPTRYITLLKMNSLEFSPAIQEVSRDYQSKTQRERIRRHPVEPKHFHQLEISDLESSIPHRNCIISSSTLWVSAGTIINQSIT